MRTVHALGLPELSLWMGKRNNSMYCYKHAQRYADKKDVGRLDRTGEASFTTMLPNEVMLVGLGGG